MHADILIFAVIAAILIYRLNAVLGTRNEDDPQRPNPFDETPQRPNPFASNPAPPQRPPARPAGTVLPLKTNLSIKPPAPETLIDSAADAEGQISEGLKDIAAADPGFDAAHFMSGAEYAFGLIVDSYAKGDRAALKPLLSPKLYADFDRGISARQSADASPAGVPSLRSVKSARIVAAHLGGTMAYITVEYHVAQASLTDASEQENLADIWTFTRDTRSSDPNWILIETRTAEK